MSDESADAVPEGDALDRLASALIVAAQILAKALDKIALALRSASRH